MVVPYLAFFVNFLPAFTLSCVGDLDHEEIPGNLRSVRLEYAGNVDLVPNHSRRLINYPLLFNVCKFAFDTLDRNLDITASMIEMLGVESQIDLHDVFEDITSQIEAIRNDMNKVNSKIDMLLKGQEKLNFQTAYRRTDGLISKIRTDFGTMKHMTEDKESPTYDGISKLFDSTREALGGFGASVNGQSGTLTASIIHLSEQENSVSNLTEYWDHIETFRNSFKKWMLTGVIVMSYGNDILQSSYSRASMKHLTQDVALHIRAMYVEHGIGFSHGKFMHVRNSPRVLASFGSKICTDSNYLDGWKGMDSRFLSPGSCNAYYSSGACNFLTEFKYRIRFASNTPERDWTSPKSSDFPCTKYSGMWNIYDYLLMARDTYLTFPMIMDTFQQHMQNLGVPLQHIDGTIQNEGYTATYWDQSKYRYKYNTGWNCCHEVCPQFKATSCYFGFITYWGKMTIIGNNILHPQAKKVTAYDSRFNRLTNVPNKTSSDVQYVGGETDPASAEAICYDVAVEEVNKLHAEFREFPPNWNVLEIFNNSLDIGGRLVDRDPEVVDNAARQVPT